ncbi:type II toxin-antitoxin system RelE/ParE family toxin [Tabrizicola sp.]|uniref:type II toxin-antitoxin system RelE/ParE family toxin n=1 Tax=Tabrizicola sp. TaxID=2005166 RepID=UPI003D2772A1
MPQLIWSPAALRDVDRLHRFLVEKNASAAREAIKAIRTHVDILAEQPGAGRPAENMAPEFREWMIPFGGSGYIALYRYDGQKAVILAVRHQREAGY